MTMTTATYVLFFSILVDLLIGIKCRTTTKPTTPTTGWTTSTTYPSSTTTFKTTTTYPTKTTTYPTTSTTYHTTTNTYHTTYPTTLFFSATSTTPTAATTSTTESMSFTPWTNDSTTSSTTWARSSSKATGSSTESFSTLSTAASTKPSLGTTSASSKPDQTTEKNDNFLSAHQVSTVEKLNIAVVVGLVVGAVFIIAVTAIMCFLLGKRRRDQSDASSAGFDMGKPSSEETRAQPYQRETDFTVSRAANTCTAIQGTVDEIDKKCQNVESTGNVHHTVNSGEMNIVMNPYTELSDAKGGHRTTGDEHLYSQLSDGSITLQENKQPTYMNADNLYINI